jgi:hypothetical protein
MQTPMRAYRLHAAGGDLSALTMVRLWFRIPPPVYEQIVLMPRRRLFHGQHPRLVVETV